LYEKLKQEKRLDNISSGDANMLKSYFEAQENAEGINNKVYYRTNTQVKSRYGNIKRFNTNRFEPDTP